MTARNQPHKYRCETCEYRSKSDYIAGSGYCLKSKKGYLTYSNNRGFTLEEYTSELGCVSHSDATKAEQRIADVIAELEKCASDVGRVKDDFSQGYKDATKHAITLLRERGE